MTSEYIQVARRRLSHGLILLAAGCVMSVCNPPRIIPSPTVLRFIEQEGPWEPFEPRALFRVKTVFAWEFQAPEDLQAWEMQHGNRTKLWSSATDFVTSSVDALEVEMKDGSASITLSWAGPGESFSATRTVPVPHVNRDANAGLKSYRIHLADHPAWKGRIVRIRLRIYSPIGDFTPHRVVASRENLVPAHLQAALARPWKIEFGNDLRNALLAWPGSPIEREVIVPKGGELHFAYAVPETVFAPIHFKVAVARPDGEPEPLFSAVAEPTASPSETALWHQARVDLSRFAGQKIRLILSTSSERVLSFGNGAPVWGHPEVVVPWKEATLPNIVLISVDTLRADHLSIYGYHRATSSHLDAWARRSAVMFQKVVAPAPWTQPSHISMFTGLNAHRHGVNRLEAAPPSLTMMTEILREAGYATVAVTGGGVLRPEFGLAPGFDIYYHLPTGYSADALEDGLTEVLTRLDSLRERPFFLFFHTYEIHVPYRARQPYFDRFSSHDPNLRTEPSNYLEQAIGKPSFVYWNASEKNPSKIALPLELATLPVDLYDSGIAYTDATLIRLLERLEQPDLTHRTMVVVTSDHGEMLGEHGLASHAFLYEENLLVPLLLALPGGRAAGRTITDQVRLIDLMPTILDLVGISLPADLDGASLLPLIDGSSSAAPRPAWSYASNSNYGVSLRMRNRLKYIRRNSAWASDYSQEQLFDLVKDPREEHDLAASARETQTLRDLISRTLEEEAVGYRVRFENFDNVAFRGTLRGPLVNPSTVKTIDLPCSCVVKKGGGAAFEVPAATSFTLLLEGYAGNGGKLLLSLKSLNSDGNEGPTFKTSLDLDPNSSPQVIVERGSEWMPVQSSDKESLKRVTVWWSGKPGTATTSPLESDILRRELEALGYL